MTTSAPTAPQGYDFSKVNVSTDGRVQIGPGQFINKDAISDNGYKMAVNYQATKDGGPTPPSLLVTSGSSRSTYNDNVNTLQEATSNMTLPPPPDPKTGETKTTPEKPVETTNADGSVTVKNADGSSHTTPNFTNIDPALRTQYDEAVKGLDAGIANAKSVLESATATMQNDPAATAAIQQIYAKFDQQIQLMKDKNTLIMGGHVRNAARNGGLQYANDMTTSFLSEEQDKATQRVANLITQETTAVLKAQQAYKDGDVKAFSAATKSYEDASKAKIDAINKLITESDKVIKTQQAQQKIDAQTAKDVVARDTKMSTALATSIADNLDKSGVTDEKTIRAYIEKMAENSGITNPDVLESAVVKARSSLGRTNLLNENTQSLMDKRAQAKKEKATKPDPGYKFNAKATKNLYSAGLNKDQVVILQQAVGKYGAKTVYDNPQLSDDVKSVIATEFGL